MCEIPLVQRTSRPERWEIWLLECRHCTRFLATCVAPGLPGCSNPLGLKCSFSHPKEFGVYKHVWFHTLPFKAFSSTIRAPSKRKKHYKKCDKKYIVHFNTSQAQFLNVQIVIKLATGHLMPSQQLPGFSQDAKRGCLEFEVGFRTAKEKETKGGKGGESHTALWYYPLHIVSGEGECWDWFWIVLDISESFG